MDHVKIAVPLDSEGIDIGGNLYPKSGFILAKNFCNDDDIRSGLWGFVNIDSSFAQSFNQEKWCLIQRTNKKIIIIDNFYNIVKFDSGIIINYGNMHYISKLMTGGD